MKSIYSNPTCTNAHVTRAISIALFPPPSVRMKKEMNG